MYSKYKSYQLIKKGGTSTIYTTKKNNIDMVIKVEKYYSADKNKYKKQILFDKKVCQNNKDIFTHVITSRLVYEETKKSKHLQGYYIGIFEILPLLDGTFNDIRELLSVSENIVCIKKILKGIQVMRINGYSHGDLHGGNIMYKLNKKETSYIYDWYIIDFNYVRINEEYVESKNVYADDINAIMMLFLPNNVYKYFKRKNKKMPSFLEIYGKIIQNKELYNKVKILFDEDFVYKYSKSIQFYAYVVFITEIFYYDEYLNILAINNIENNDYIQIYNRDGNLIKLLGVIIKNISCTDIYDKTIQYLDV